jgi:hypothetical protein
MKGMEDGCAREVKEWISKPTKTDSERGRKGLSVVDETARRSEKKAEGGRGRCIRRLKGRPTSDMRKRGGKRGKKVVSEVSHASLSLGWFTTSSPQSGLA